MNVKTYIETIVMLTTFILDCGKVRAAMTHELPITRNFLDFCVPFSGLSIAWQMCFCNKILWSQVVKKSESFFYQRSVHFVKQILRGLLKIIVINNILIYKLLSGSDITIIIIMCRRGER